MKLRLGEDNSWLSPGSSLSSSSFSFPVGTILPWLNRLQAPDGQFKLSPDLPPPGWQLCDGQVRNITKLCPSTKKVNEILLENIFWGLEGIRGLYATMPPSHLLQDTEIMFILRSLISIKRKVFS